MPYYVSLALLLLVGSVADEALEPAGAMSRFSDANHAYDAGQYTEATSTYEDLLAQGYASGWLDYNLGNSYLRAGQLGKAIAHFRRSQSDLPRDGDVRANLAFAREKTQDAIAPPGPAPWQHTLLFWHYALSWRELAWCTGLINALVWSLFITARLRPQAEPVRWAFGITLVMLLATAGSLAVRTVSPSLLAVVTQPEISVHSGTDRDTVVRFKLHEGTEMRLRDIQDNWARVELTDGKQGWVVKQDVTVVTL